MEFTPISQMKELRSEVTQCVRNKAVAINQSIGGSLCQQEGGKRDQSSSE